jgi:hypothetical protein
VQEDAGIIKILRDFNMMTSVRNGMIPTARRTDNEMVLFYSEPTKENIQKIRMIRWIVNII